MRFVADKAALGQVFSEYFGFPCQFSFGQMLHTHLLVVTGTTGQLLADIPSGLSLIPPHEIKKNIYIVMCKLFPKFSLKIESSDSTTISGWNKIMFKH
jgi:hypothetical protein